MSKYHRMSDNNHFRYIINNQSKENIVACKIFFFLLYYNYDLKIANQIAEEFIKQHSKISFIKIVDEIILLSKQYFFDLPYEFDSIKSLFKEKEGFNDE